jgi:hypothetical protein
MKRIFLLTHLNGPDNRGGAPFGMPSTTIEVEDSVADDAIARGFATAAKDETITSGDPYAHLHISAVAARNAANSARTAADKAQADSDKASVDADAADKVANDAEAAASKAEHGAPYDAQASANAQKNLDAFNATHSDPLSAADQAARDDLTARRDRANAQPAPRPVGLTTADEPGAPKAIVA